MYSKFGDLYDHISDAVILLSLAYVFYKKPMKTNTKMSILAFMLVTGSLCWMYYRKQEEYYNVLKNNPENIDKVNMSSMTYLRFFGPGCMALFIAIIISFS
jgi:phosphatidylglycerophosphate synthase